MILLYHLIFRMKPRCASWNAGNLSPALSLPQALQWLTPLFIPQSGRYLAFTSRTRACRGKAALTFDDATLATTPASDSKEGIPATFFTNSSNLNHGLLWFCVL